MSIGARIIHFDEPEVMKRSRKQVMSATTMSSRESARSEGRMIDRDQSASMERKKQEGYF